MSYNIIKIMNNPQTDKKMHVLLTDGISQIWDIKTKEEALKISIMLNDNTDSGHEYVIREACNRKK